MFLKRIFRMQNELDNWLNKYDDFMETQNGKIAEIQAEYDVEKADMTDLQEKFIKLKGNFNRKSPKIHQCAPS